MNGMRTILHKLLYWQLGVITGILISVPALHAAANETLVGRIVVVEGNVDLISIRDRSRKQALAGEPLYQHQQIRTGSEALVRVTLIDSTRLEIREFSVVNIQKLAHKDDINPLDVPFSVRMLGGKMRLQVSRSNAKNKRFYFKTPTVVAAVRGTDFACIATLEDARLVVFEGLVEVANRSKTLRRSYMLKPRQETRVREGKEPLPPRFIQKDEMKNYLQRYEITKLQQIRKRIREPETFIDKLFKKAGR